MLAVKGDAVNTLLNADEHSAGPYNFNQPKNKTLLQADIIN
jgi:hypothetical protein